MIVGICGMAGSGKDTVGSFLRKDHGFESIAFADPMKRFCADVFDWDEERLWGPSERRNAEDTRYPRRSADGEGVFLTARHALQTLGTEWGRDCFPAVWVDYAIRLARRLDGAYGLAYDRRRGVFQTARDKCPGVCITDVRFRNEVDAVHAAGGVVWRVSRPGAGLSGAAAGHASETEMAGLPASCFDFLIGNGGTLLDLRRSVTDALRASG